jgi:acyl-CoA thioester hydrolase
MDAYGIVNNVIHLAYLEQARVSLIETANLAVLDTGVVVSRHEIDYKIPLVYRPEPILVDIWVSDIRRRSWTFQYVIRDETGVVYARASSTMVAWDRASRGSRSLTDDEHARLETMLDDG